MYVMKDEVGAIALMVVSLWCLGSWPALFNVLEQRGRVPMHTYLDYTIANFAVALLFAFTLGEIGPGTNEFPNFITQLFQENGASVAFAMFGGLALCLGNMGMQYSLAFVGISLTEVVSASLAVVLGTTVNYFLDDGLNRASILFPGVACFLVAVVLGSFCHASNAADIAAKLEVAQDDVIRRKLGDDESTTNDSLEYVGLLSDPGSKSQRCMVKGSEKESGSSYTITSHGDKSSSKDMEEEQFADNAVVGSAEFFEDLESHRAIKVKGKSVLFGLVITLFTGVCYAAFSPLFNLATNDQFHLLKPGVPHLVVYTTFFYFSIALLIASVIFNVYLLYNPVLGIPKSSLKNYINDWEGRHLALIAGLVCGLGNGFQFMGGQAAGYAAADAVQALPLVGTLWGIVLFGEYHGSSRKTHTLLVAMLSMFAVAVFLLIASSTERRVLPKP